MTRIEFRIRELRQAKGITQVERAERAEIDQGAISRIESGQARSVSLDALARLCDALDCDLSELLLKVGKKRKKRT